MDVSFLKKKPEKHNEKKKRRRKEKRREENKRKEKKRKEIHSANGVGQNAGLHLEE